MNLYSFFVIMLNVFAFTCKFPSSGNDDSSSRNDEVHL